MGIMLALDYMRLAVARLEPMIIEQDVRIKQAAFIGLKKFTLLRIWSTAIASCKLDLQFKTSLYSLAAYILFA